ncbi:metal-dependent hydrolase [Planctomycetota bacterium]
MPTTLTHIFIAGAGCQLKVIKENSVRVWSTAIVCSVLQDADVIAFSLGVEYGDFFGHRGFFHSVFFAFVLAFLAGVIYFRDLKVFSKKWWGSAGDCLGSAVYMASAYSPGCWT